MRKTFQDYANRAMKTVVESHQRTHPLYKPTKINQFIIDEQGKKAVFVLFEQIDTDRVSDKKGDHGALGDQYRYSIWYVEPGKDPSQLYEDHAYIRQEMSTLTASKGRDASINIDRLSPDGIDVNVTPKDAEGGKYSKVKIRIKLDGTIEEPEDFLEQAKNLVTRTAKKLGSDWIDGVQRLENRDIAAIRYSTENGSTYGFDTIYLVWRNMKGELRHKELVNSRGSQEYIFVKSMKEKDGEIIVEVNGKAYATRIQDINMP